jgi:parallel beta-helix repeat protein
MNKKLIFAIAVICILISTLTISIKAQIFLTNGLIFIMPTNNGTIFIMPDGSINGTTNIQTTDNTTYVFTSNIYNDSIIVERDNIIIDGNGCALQGTGAYNADGISLSGRTNVTVERVSIQNFVIGIFLGSSSKCRIFGNNVTNTGSGIFLGSSSNNTVSGNKATGIQYGIVLDSSSNNTVFGNIAMSNQQIGIDVESSFNNTISENNVFESGYFGLYLEFSSNNTLCGNNVTNNWLGIAFDISSDYNSVFGNYIANNHECGIQVGWALIKTSPSNNIFFHNSFVNNSRQVYCAGSPNAWDNGYPSGGNYWSDYHSSDVYSGPYQNESGYDWIGDSPYVIDHNNIDRYPLMYPYVPDVDSIRIAYRSLLEDYNELQTNFTGLNSTYQHQLSDYSKLQENYTSVQNSYNNLQTNFASLNSSYINVNTTLNQYKESTQNELSYTRDLVYALTAITITLIVAIVYFSVWKPKRKRGRS